MNINNSMNININNFMNINNSMNININNYKYKYKY